MTRSILTAFALSSVLVPVSFATAQSRSPIEHGDPVIGLAPYFGRYELDRPEARLSVAQQLQARRWQGVGQCVVGRDRSASLSYVTAPVGSDTAVDAMTRLKPAFAACLKGAQIDEPGSRPLRRAAVADALGVFIPAR